jgi:hypothetical protein
MAEWLWLFRLPSGQVVAGLSVDVDCELVEVIDLLEDCYFGDVIAGRSRWMSSCMRWPSGCAPCWNATGCAAYGRPGGMIRLGMDTGAGMDGQSENSGEPRSEPVVAGLAPPDELETDAVPDSLVSDFSSLTTPYCWVITEDAIAGYHGAEPSAVGKSGPGQAVAQDITEALTAGRFFRLAGGQGHELAIGRLYDPSGQNELAPLDEQPSRACPGAGRADMRPYAPPARPRAQGRRDSAAARHASRPPEQ